ncbi:hypothetical protein COCCADRAFT_83121 [Bipolaris zeicola 26-R-13]|uniref:Uncharacterized protein n=1 Tax=Cochliobolus carbonum (strain 26-R-13) TaxID=930089 RepID=W6YSI2_COCC2|nr:uncharacterized protein COCCADRAFT_83121 [Bipolaris zeicola 26-R-13]EUC38364.1 hypothetical protein COCCADRAFT_83121 [Bipolaris zeicola 26-R-13]
MRAGVASFVGQQCCGADHLYHHVISLHNKEPRPLGPRPLTMYREWRSSQSVARRLSLRTVHPPGRESIYFI